MRAFGRWLVASPIRIIEVCSGLLLLGVATLVWDSAAGAVSTFVLGSLLLFLTLYSYLKHGKPGP